LEIEKTWSVARPSLVENMSKHCFGNANGGNLSTKEKQEQLAGIQIVGGIEEYEYGRFA